MKIFGKTFFESTPNQPEQKEPGDTKMSFSTPFMKIGKGNLGTPYINPYYTISGIIQFGSDNLYPQILDQMYYTSPMHSGCIDFIANAAVGGGYEYKNPALTGVEQVNIYTFEKVNKFKKLVRTLANDFLLHKRICVVIIRGEDGKFKSMKRLNPSTIRNNEAIDKFQYCKDWSRRTGLIEYNLYSPHSKDLESLYVYYEESVGQDVYPLPSYISVLNDVFLDGEIAFLQKSNIQNSIWPSLAIRIPKVLESAEEIESFKEGLSSKSGAKEAGKIMVLQGNGFDNCPEVIPIATNQNDKLFNTTLDSITNKICIAHGINPAIMGIKVAGSLGNAQELQMSYAIFEKNVIMPLRGELTEIYDALLDISGIKNSIIINDFQVILSGESSEAEQSLASKLGIGGTQTLVSILSDPLLSKQQKVSAIEVLYNLPPEQSLRLVYGGGEDAGASSIADEKNLSKESIATNDALRNMTGKQQQQLVRIIRQYGQGKITKEVAAIQLRNGFGLSEEDINLMLIETE